MTGIRRVDRAIAKRGDSTIGGPSRSMYHAGDTVVLTRPLNHLGEKGKILKLYYLPASYRKGYYDYAAEIQLIEGPNSGQVLRVLQGNFKKEETLTAEYLLEHKKVLEQQFQRAKERRQQRKRDQQIREIAGGEVIVLGIPAEGDDNLKKREQQILSDILEGGKAKVDDLERLAVIQVFRR